MVYQPERYPEQRDLIPDYGYTILYLPSLVDLDGTCRLQAGGKKKDLENISYWIHEFCELNINELLFIELTKDQYAPYAHYEKASSIHGCDVAHIMAGVVAYSCLPSGEMVEPDQLWEFYYYYLIENKGVIGNG